MKTYDTIQMLRRLAFGATLLTATALLPACDDDPAAPDEELTTDPGTSVQPETLRFISYNILEGMKLDKAQNFDNFVDWVKEKDPDFMALCECNAFTEESLTALAGRYGHPYAVLCKESGFPVGLTSKYPIELRNRLLEDVPLWHILAQHDVRRARQPFYILAVMVAARKEVTTHNPLRFRVFAPYLRHDGRTLLLAPNIHSIADLSGCKNNHFLQHPRPYLPTIHRFR